MITETYSKDLIGALQSKINPSFSLLDVGCGLCLMARHFDCQVVLALDIHRPYLENRRDRSPRVIPIHADAMDLDKLFLPKTVSTVLLNDTIEHFTKKDGLRLLRMAETVAVQRVVVFTPRGWFPQEEYDHFGMNGHKYQAHRSGWEPEEFVQLGYQVLVFKGFHDAANPSFVRAFGPHHPPVDAILAWKG